MHFCDDLSGGMICKWFESIYVCSQNSTNFVVICPLLTVWTHAWPVYDMMPILKFGSLVKSYKNVESKDNFSIVKMKPPYLTIDYLRLCVCSTLYCLHAANSSMNRCNCGVDTFSLMLWYKFWWYQSQRIVHVVACVDANICDCAETILCVGLLLRILRLMAKLKQACVRIAHGNINFHYISSVSTFRI